MILAAYQPMGSRIHFFHVVTAMFALLVAPLSGAASAPSGLPLSKAARQYLGLIENFAGFAEQHWNEKEGCYDAHGSGVTWARGNCGVCLVMAVLLTELPERTEFFPQKISRAVLLNHTRRAIRSVSCRRVPWDQLLARSIRA